MRLRSAPLLLVLFTSAVAPIACASGTPRSGAGETVVPAAPAAEAPAATAAEPPPSTTEPSAPAAAAEPAAAREPSSEAGATAEAANAGTTPWTPADRAAAPKGLEFGKEPPDGRWRRDDTGEYFVHGLPKIPGHYRLDPKLHTVQIDYGLKFLYIDEDDQYVYIKIYRPTDAAPVPIRRQADPAELAAWYATTTPTADRLRLEPWMNGAPTSGQWRDGIAVGDMNEDGHPDLVHGPIRKGGSQPWILLGDGAGNWKRWREAEFPSDPIDYGDVAVADLDGDRHLDIVISSHLRGFIAYRGDGKGHFTRWNKGMLLTGPEGLTNEPLPTSRAIAVVDWNGDRRPDIAAQGEGPRLALTPAQGPGGLQRFNEGARGLFFYLNQGDGSWKLEQIPGRTYGDSLAVGDFFGDRKPSLVAAVSATGQPPEILPYGKSEVVSMPAARANTYARTVAAADFDGDGRADVAVGYQARAGKDSRHGVDLYLSRPTGWERHAVVADTGETIVWRLGAGDLDGDGRADLVAATDDGQAWVLLGDGKGGFTRDPSPELDAPGPGCIGSEVRLADLDGRRGDELVLGWAGETRVGVSGRPEPPCPGNGALRIYRLGSTPR